MLPLLIKCQLVCVGFIVLCCLFANFFPPYIKYLQQDDGSYQIIEAKKWDLDKNGVNLEINLPEYLNVKDKVLTMVVYAKKADGMDGGGNGEKDYSDPPIPLTSHTFFNS